MARNWDFEINGNYYKMDEFGKVFKVEAPSSGDFKEGLETEIPNLEVGRDLLGNIISLNYKGNNDYKSIIEDLPSTPLTSKQSQGDSKNISVGLIDTLKANSLNLNKTIETQNDILVAHSVLMADVVQNLALVSSSLNNLALNSNETKELKKSSLTTQILKHSKDIDRLDFESTGELKLNPNDLSIMDKLNGKTTEPLKDDEDNPIIPREEKAKYHSKQNDRLSFDKKGHNNLKDTEGNIIKPREAKAKKDAESAIEKEDMNRTTIDELLDFTLDMVGFGVEGVDDLFDGSLGDGYNTNPFEYIISLIKGKEEAYINELKGD